MTIQDIIDYNKSQLTDDDKRLQSYLLFNYTGQQLLDFFWNTLSSNRRGLIHEELIDGAEEGDYAAHLCTYNTYDGKEKDTCWAALIDLPT